MILKQTFRPGERILESPLSQSLGFSRTPVREAIRQLEQDGLIVTTGRVKRVHLLTIGQVKEIFDLKVAIESQVAGWAAQRSNAADRQKLGETLERMKRIAGSRPADGVEEDSWLRAWLNEDEKLHEVIFRMAGNRTARRMINNLNVQWHRLRLGIVAMEGRIEQSIDEHEVIVEAISDGKPSEAEQAMRIHLEKLSRVLIRLMEVFDYPTG
jgi:DNA-binding GntR family transcriptional regulator